LIIRKANWHYTDVRCKSTWNNKQNMEIGIRLLNISHGIDEARQEIRRIKGALRNLGIKVEDRPGDDEPLYQEMPSTGSVLTRSSQLTRLPTLAILTLLIAALVWLITTVIHSGGSPQAVLGFLIIDHPTAV
jgi:hypothetical protein